jgi:predicted dehydrogenase
MALIDYDGRLPDGDGYQSLSVIAATGGAYADDHQNTQLVYNGGQPRGVRTEERTRQLAAMAQAFVDGVQSGRDFATGIEDWRRVFLVVDAIHQSLQLGRAVALEGR